MGILARLAVCSLLVLVPSAQAYDNKAKENLPTPVPDDCLHCICVVESKCTMPSPVCQMDVGSLSCGPYQIKEDYYNEARKEGGSLMGDWKNCTATFECSGEAVQGYMARYAVFSRLGHDPTCEDFARIHNGGPNGYKKTSTLLYWARVKACLLA